MRIKYIYARVLRLSRGDAVRRGQAGIEYVILVGLMLIFLIPIIHYALNEATLNVKINQIDTTVRRIAKASDAVFSLGRGAREVVTVTLPHGISTSKVNGHEIGFEVSLFGKITDVYFPTKPQVIGSLPTDPGTYRIVVMMLETNNVSIGKIM